MKVTEIERPDIIKGTVLYRLNYFSSRASWIPQERQIERRVVQKRTPLYIFLTNKQKLGIHAVDTKYADYFTTKLQCYENAIQKHLKEYEEPLNEIRYLQKKIEQIQKEQEK